MARLLRFLLPVFLLLLAAAPSAHAKVAPDFVGMTSEDVFAGDDVYRADNLTLQRSLGVGVLRQTFDWARIEPTRGVYDFAYYDDYMLATAARGVRVLPILFNPPRFHARQRAGTTCPPRKNSSLAAFAQAVVRRYGPKGSLWSEHPEVKKRPLVSYQIWNEPLLAQYWCKKPNAAEYAKMLKTVGGAIKRLQRGAEIVTAGLPPSKLSGAIAFRKYIRQLYQAGGKSAFDTMAINSYAQGPAQLGRLLVAVRQLMDERGDKRAKIWVTELGWGDKGPRHRFIVGAKGQAQRITGSFRYIGSNKRRLGLRGVVYFSWRDGEPYAPDFKNLWGLHTGLLKKDGTPKPAFNAFRAAARKLR